MKTTIDIPDDLYRAVKSRSARDGMTVRGVTLLLYGDWLARPGWIPAPPVTTSEPPRTERRTPLPAWFGIGRSHVRRNADGPHDIATLRKAVAAGIATERTAKGDGQ